MINRLYQKRSIIVASLIAIIALAWVLSGLGREPEPALDTSSAAASNVTSEAPALSVLVEQRIAAETWQQFEGAGAVEAKRSVDVLSAMDARVVGINVEAGDVVKANDVLVDLSPKHIPQQLRLAKARLEQAELQYQSSKKLAAKGLQNQLGVAEAKSALEAAKADVAGAEVAVRELKLRAPFAGTVQVVDVELGDFIRTGERGLRLVQADELLAVVAVTAEVATQLSKGQALTVTSRQGDTYPATVNVVAPEPEQQSRLYRVEASLQNTGIATGLAIGQPVELLLPLKKVKAHRVPASLLWLDSDGNMGLRAVDADNRVRFHTAKFLRSEGGEIWLTGLPETFSLIVKGQGLVRTGALVMPEVAKP